MKKLLIIGAAALALAGCQLTHVKTDEWEVSLRSHWFKRDLDKFEVQRNADGSYSVALNGYHSDASEQFNQMLQQSFQGLALLGRLAGAAVNPAVASVPLTAEPAAAGDIERLIQAQAEAKRGEIAAKAELAKVKAKPATSPDPAACEDCKDVE